MLTNKHPIFQLYLSMSSYNPAIILNKYADDDENTSYKKIPLIMTNYSLNFDHYNL